MEADPNNLRENLSVRFSGEAGVVRYVKTMISSIKNEFLGFGCA